MNMDYDSVQLPTISDFFNPVLEALRQLGGEGSNDAIDAQVVSLMEISDAQLAIGYEGAEGKPTKVEHRIAWARSQLKAAGYLENPRRATWALTPLGRRTRNVDPGEVRRLSTQSGNDGDQPPQRRRRRSTASRNEPLLSMDEFTSTSTNWRGDLAAVIQDLSPGQIERLMLLLFQADGMRHIETLPSGRRDELDGFMSSGGALGLRISFRFMRGSGMTSADELDEFRRFAGTSGAVNGILFSTPGFTGEALRSASQGGVPRIELYDLDRLIDALMGLSLGISMEVVRVERVVVDRDFFASL